jgi:hypothetical protein
MKGVIMFITIALTIGAAAMILLAINLPSIQKRQYTVVKPRRATSLAKWPGERIG